MNNICQSDKNIITENYLLYKSTVIEETNINSHIDNLKKRTTNNNCVTFNSLVYLEEIYKSYNNIEGIYRQFDLDCNRTNIEINDKKITEIKEFDYNIGWLKNIGIANKNIINLYQYIVMLTLQSSYWFPYMLLHKIYCEDAKNLVISNLSTNRNIYINTLTEYTQIIIEFDSEIKNYHTDTTIKNINSTLYIKFGITNKILDNLASIEKQYNIDYIFDKNGLFIWEINNPI